MRKAFLFPFLLLAAALFTASIASAGEPRTHDGFFLRLSGGVGYASTSAENVEFNGLTGDYNFAIGGVIAKDLALHGTFFGWSIGDPDIEVSGTDVGNAGEALTLSAMGGGVTYYAMPANIYLSGNVGLA